MNIFKRIKHSVEGISDTSVNLYEREYRPLIDKMIKISKKNNVVLVVGVQMKIDEPSFRTLIKPKGFIPNYDMAAMGAISMYGVDFLIDNIKLEEVK